MKILIEQATGKVIGGCCGNFTGEKPGRVAVELTENDSLLYKLNKGSAFVFQNGSLTLTAYRSAVPKEIPLWAFRQVLIEDGLLTQIKTYINSLESGVAASLTNFLEYGNFVTRKSTALNSIATAIGKTDAEIDALFIRAAKLRL